MNWQKTPSHLLTLKLSGSFSLTFQEIPRPFPDMKNFCFSFLSDGGNPDVEMFIMLVMRKYHILWGSFSQY